MQKKFKKKLFQENLRSPEKQKRTKQRKSERQAANAGKTLFSSHLEIVETSFFFFFSAVYRAKYKKTKLLSRRSANAGTSFSFFFLHFTLQNEKRKNQKHHFPQFPNARKSLFSHICRMARKNNVFFAAYIPAFAERRDKNFVFLYFTR